MINENVDRLKSLIFVLTHCQVLLYIFFIHHVLEISNKPTTLYKTYLPCNSVLIDFSLRVYKSIMTKPTIISHKFCNYTQQDDKQSPVLAFTTLTFKIAILTVLNFFNPKSLASNRIAPDHS